jgi:hypothetical protein
VGLAAYITGKKLYDEENQRGTYRGHPGDVLSWGTIAPSWAPSYLTDPEHLAKAWNDAQRSEKRVDSHLANHWDIGLWRNATPERNRNLMEKIARNVTERYGIMVTWAVHEPSGEGSEHNFHGHLAMNMRRITETGFGPKAREIVDGKTRRLETEWMRRMIADEINDFLKSVNSDERISHQSYRQRGILKEPMVHMGANAWQAEKRGASTELGDKNRKIRDRNRQAEQEEKTLDADYRKAIREGQVLYLNAQRLERIAAGKQPMELTEGQATRRGEEIRDAMGQVDSLTEGVSLWWQNHLREQKDAEAERKERERDGRAVREEEITDAGSRWGKSSNRFGNPRDPEGSMAIAAWEENAQFKREQEALRMAEAKESDPTKREMLKLRRHIEASEYMALTSERLVGVSQFIGGSRGGRDLSESEEFYREEAKKYREIASNERKQLGDLHKLETDKGYEALEAEIARLRRQPEASFNRRMNARPKPQQETSPDDLGASNQQFFGVAQPLADNAPNRDRPQKGQRAPINYQPGNASDHTVQREAGPERNNGVDRARDTNRRADDGRGPETRIEDPQQFAEKERPKFAAHRANERMSSREERQAAREERLQRAGRGDHNFEVKQERRGDREDRKDAEGEITDRAAERQAKREARLEQGNQQQQQRATGNGRSMGGHSR